MARGEEKINTVETKVEILTNKYQDELNKIVGIYNVIPVMETWLTRMPNSTTNLYPGNIFLSYTPERDPSTGLIITGLTKLQQEAFENEMTLPAGSLSQYNLDYWCKYFIRVPEKGIQLNCNSIIKDKLNYILLKNHSKVANSSADLPFKSSAELLMTSEEIEKKETSIQVDMKEKAYAKLATMSIEERLDFLKVYEEGKFKVSKSAKPDFINSSIGKIVDKETSTFLETFNNPYYKEAIFLRDCIDVRAVTKIGPSYYVTGADMIGKNYIDTLTNLQSPNYNEIKISLLGKIQASK